MPLALVLVVIDAVLIIHAAKTGRFWPWAYVILFLTGFGALGYILVELLPEWLGSPKAQNARRQVVQSLDPERRYRKLADELEGLDTIANRAALAQECLALGKFEEAKLHYDHILSLPLGDDPIYALGKARAEFGLGNPQATVIILDELRARWPDYQSAEGHLLYARALEASGRSQQALSEYEAVSHYYPGAEARVRYGSLLDQVGRHAEAKVIFADVLKLTKRAPKHVRKAQAEWINIAETALRG